MRDIPGRRKVYAGKWNGIDVIAKIFEGRFSARRYVKRECSALKELLRRGIVTARPLFYGSCEGGKAALVIEKIGDGITAIDVFKDITDTADRNDFMLAVFKQLAQQHNRGILQDDLHLGNFLVLGRKFYPIDAGRMRFIKQHPEKSKSLDQAAVLISSIGLDEAIDIEKLLYEYARTRGWTFNQNDFDSFKKKLFFYRNKAVANWVKKCLRTSKRNIRFKGKGFRGVFKRIFLEGISADGFNTNIDRLMDTGQILKRGNTCYVSRFNLIGSDIVVKRFNHKGFIHSLRNTIRRCRAKYCWIEANRLLVSGIATPAALGYFEKRRFGILWCSYYISQYIDGPSFYELLRDSNISRDLKAKAIGQAKWLLWQLKENMISHSDLKQSNILFDNNGAKIIDLEAIKAHKSGIACQRRLKKSIIRFYDDIEKIKETWP